MSWWSWPGSNRLPPACKANALPNELQPLIQNYFITLNKHTNSQWWVWLDLNQRPHAYQACALTNWATNPSIFLFYQDLLKNKFKKQFVWAPNVLSKEVIQPQVPLRLPCYDLTPVMEHTVVSALLSVRLPASGTIHSHGLTGGVYKARERIHRDILIRDY